MKHLLYILLFAITVGCSNDDDTSDPDISSSGLNGTWNLVNVLGGFVGIDHDFENGVIIWDFDENNNTVNITNNNTDNTIYDVLPTGTYTYSLVDIQGNQELVVGDRNLGNLEINDSEFTVNEQFRDGFRVTFRR